MNIKWYIKHIPNLVIRVISHDKYYICEECGAIHNRDGDEIRLDTDYKHLMSNPIWYGSVACKCFEKQQREVSRLLHDAMVKRLGL